MFFYVFTYNFLKITFYSKGVLKITHTAKKNYLIWCSRSEVMGEHTFQRFIFIYKNTRWLPRFAVTQCGCMDEELQCSRKLRFWPYYLWLFLQVALSHIPLLRVLEVHLNDIRGIITHITEHKIHINYSENHDSSLFFYYFYMSPFPTLVHIVAKGILFRSVLFSMLLN